MPEKKYEVYDLPDAESKFEEEEEEPTRLEKLASKPCLLFCVYCGLIGYGLFSVLFDWLWARDMLLTDSGLVFGPPNTVTIVFLFLIASIGTIAFVLEIVSFSLKVFKGKPLMDEDIAQLLTLFLEEVPSISLSLVLAQCREVPVSYYMLAKAALQMFGSGFRAIRSIIRYFNPEKHRYTGCIAFTLRTLIFATCLYCGIAACLVWVFTYVSPPEDGGDFRPPGSIWQKSYDNGRYFYKSGVYLSHPSFAHCNNTVLWNETRVNWIKIDSITDILQSEDDDVEVFFYFNDTSNIIIIKNTAMNEQPDECYFTDITNNCIVKPFDCTPPDITSMTALTFNFHPTEKSKTLVYGDIKFRSALSYVQDGSLRCEDMTNDEWGFLYANSGIQGQLQYFKLTNENYNDTYAYYENDQGLLGYYELDTELANVTEVWLTGYDKCQMTGSLSPNKDNSLTLPCL